MAGLHLDTSTLGRVLLREPDAAAIRSALARYDTFWSSTLLDVELRRLAAKVDLVDEAERLLAGVRRVPIDAEIVASASTVAPVDVRIPRRAAPRDRARARKARRGRGEVAAVLTFDRQLQRACGHHAPSVEAPA